MDNHKEYTINNSRRTHLFHRYLQVQSKLFHKNNYMLAKASIKVKVIFSFLRMSLNLWQKWEKSVKNGFN